MEGQLAAELVGPGGLQTDPATTAMMATVCYTIVEILKKVTGWEGNKARVQGLSFLVSLLFTLAWTLYRTPTTPPITGHLLFDVFMRALLISGGGIGINNLKHINADPAQHAAAVALRSLNVSPELLSVIVETARRMVEERRESDAGAAASVPAHEE